MQGIPTGGLLLKGQNDMANDDVTQIIVHGRSIGIIGLKRILEETVDAFSGKSLGEVETELLRRLSKRNYIPKKAQEAYRTAFVREYKKLLGLSYDEETPKGLIIKILGQGCTQCDGLEKSVIETMALLNLVGDVEHVREVKEIGKYGVMGVPALIINGKVKAVGHVPPKSKIEQWLLEAHGKPTRP